MPEPGTERDAALATADDNHIGLLRAAQFLLLFLAQLCPGAAIASDTMRDALLAREACFFLVTLEFLERGEDGEALAIP